MPEMPALDTVDEGFEVVRRRRFEPMSDPNQYKDPIRVPSVFPPCFIRVSSVANSPCSFPPDDDGIIPITDTDWFPDDATNRLVEFIATAWPGEKGSKKRAVGSGRKAANPEDQSTTYRLPPTGYHLPPTTYHLPPTTYRLPPRRKSHVHRREPRAEEERVFAGQDPPLPVPKALGDIGLSGRPSNGRRVNQRTTEDRRRSTKRRRFRCARRLADLRVGRPGEPA